MTPTNTCEVAAPLHTLIIDRLKYWLSLSEKVDNNVGHLTGRTFGRGFPPASCDPIAPEPVYASFVDEFSDLAARLNKTLNSVDDGVLEYANRV